ncbi:ankyrin repeat-containing domain protein [Globomyces pollinis-pini]|nr:ankyrin repeat-containing domain protein [Globomyces pollinis-pini]
MMSFLHPEKGEGLLEALESQRAKSAQSTNLIDNSKPRRPSRHTTPTSTIDLYSKEKSIPRFPLEPSISVTATYTGESQDFLQSKSPMVSISILNENTNDHSLQKVSGGIDADNEYLKSKQDNGRSKTPRSLVGKFTISPECSVNYKSSANIALAVPVTQKNPNSKSSNNLFLGLPSSQESTIGNQHHGARTSRRPSVSKPAVKHYSEEAEIVQTRSSEIIPFEGQIPRIDDPINHQNEQVKSSNNRLKIGTINDIQPTLDMIHNETNETIFLDYLADIMQDMSELSKQRLFDRAVLFGKLRIALVLLHDGMVNPAGQDQLAIITASKQGNIELFNLIIQNPDVDATFNLNECIRLASSNGHHLIVKELLEIKSIDPGTKNNEPLKSACKQGHLQVCRLLLKDKRVNPNDFTTKSALTLACEYGHQPVVKLLLSCETVDPSEPDNSAIITAVSKNRDKIVSMLLGEPEINPGTKENICLKRACQTGYESIVQMLLCDRRVNPAASDNEPLQLACQNNHESIALHLLDCPTVNPSCNNNICIMYSAINGNEKLFKKLLKCPNVDPTIENHRIIEIICENGFEELLKLALIDGRLNPIINDYNPLRLAIKKNYMKCFEMLLNDQRVDRHHNNDEFKRVIERLNSK